MIKEIILNKEYFESMNGSFETVFDKVDTASQFAFLADNSSCMRNLAVKESDDIRSIIRLIIDSFSSTDQKMKEKAQSIIGVDIHNGISSGGNIIINLTSDAYNSVSKSCDYYNVYYFPVKKRDVNRSDEEIIKSLYKEDDDLGSCASLAFAYVGANAGYDVKDHRGGYSWKIFRHEWTVDKIIRFQGVESYVTSGNDDFRCVNELMNRTVEGKEYILFTGSHAAVVRNNGGRYEYLELQIEYPNEPNPHAHLGWHDLSYEALDYRFWCDKDKKNDTNNYLIDAESLANSPEFVNMLGYINTVSGGGAR